MKASDTAYTPKAVAEQVVREILRAWGFPLGGHVIDVGAGLGALTRAAINTLPPCNVTAIEPREECQEALWAIAGFGQVQPAKCTVQEYTQGQAELVIGNPPFSLVAEVVPAALSHRKPMGVVCLLGLLDWGQRCTSTERQGRKTHRAVWLETPPTHCWRIPGSINMRLGGSGDARSYCWWIWAPGPRLHPSGWITTDLPCLPGAARRVTAEECGVTPDNGDNA